MDISLAPGDMLVVRRFALEWGLTVEEALRVFLEVAINDGLGDDAFRNRLINHAAVVKISRRSEEPPAEPRSRW